MCINMDVKRYITLFKPPNYHCLSPQITVMSQTPKSFNASGTISSIATGDCRLHQQAVENSLQPNILSSLSSGKILFVNPAACTLLGYSQKELLTKNRKEILTMSDRSFKKRLKNRGSIEHLMVSAIKKNGNLVACEITSAVFTGPAGTEKAIITLYDMTQLLQEQKDSHNMEEKIVADNIHIARLRQKKIDTSKEKVVAGNILLAKSKQKRIDGRKEKIVAGNIRAAKAMQREIDVNKDKITEKNIVQALEASDKRLAAQKHEFITIASHELKTPITCLKAYVQLMQIELPAKNSVMSEMLTKANEQIDKLTGLTNNLLSTVHIEQGKLKGIL